MYSNLREWLAQVDEMGQLKHITEEIDWHLEMGALTYMVGKKMGSPALLFENIKGYSKDYRVLFNMLGTGKERIALALGLPTNLSVIELIQATREKMKKRVEPVYVDPKTAPVNENIQFGDDVDLLKFPVPKMWPRDGGRYMGTADVIITRNPETGVINLGTYRQMVQSKNEVGFYISPGKDGKLHREAWWKLDKPCEVAAVYGVDPLMFMVGAQGYPRNISEYEFIGGLMGKPVEIINGEVTDLPIPAQAEIVIEGIAYPGNTRGEGPFGEFTGYYGRPGEETPLIDVKCIHHRNQPILTSALMADYPSCEQNFFFSIIRSAKIWDDLENMGIPGIKGVYSHPAAAGGFGMVVISMQQLFAGHAAQVLALTAQCPAAAYYTKWIVAVEEDVDPTNMDEVIWAMSTRCSPVDDIDILRNTWSTYLDPTLNPPEIRPYGSKALINACREHKYLNVFSVRSKVTRAMYDRLSAKWSKLGLDGEPPALRAFEEEVLD